METLIALVKNAGGTIWIVLSTLCQFIFVVSPHSTRKRKKSRWSSELASGIETLAPIQMLSGTPYAVDLHNHYFGHWKSTEGDKPGDMNFVKHLIGKDYKKLDENLDKIMMGLPAISVGGDSVTTFFGTEEHLGWATYNKPSYSGYVGDLDKRLELRGGNAGVELTSSITKKGHVGLPFIEIANEEIRSLFKKPHELAVLQDSLLKDELKVLNHPVQEPNHDVKNVKETRDFIDKVYIKSLRTDPNQKASVAAIEFPHPNGDKWGEVKQVERLFLGMNADGFFVAPSLGSDSHVTKGKIGKLKPFSSGGVTFAFSKQGDAAGIEAAFANRWISTSFNHDMPSDNKSNSISAPLLRLTETDSDSRTATVELVGDESGLDVQLIIALKSKLSVDGDLPDPATWKFGFQGELGAFKVLQVDLDSHGWASIELPDDTAFAYARAVSKTDQLSAITTPISYNKNQSLEGKPLFASVSDEIRLSSAIAVPKQTLLSEGLAGEFDWSVRSSDSSIISVNIDDGAIFLSPVAEGKATIEIIASDGDEESRMTISVIADGSLIRSMMESLQQGVSKAAVIQGNVKSQLVSISNNLETVKGQLRRLESDTEERAGAISQAKADLKAAKDAEVAASSKYDSATDLLNRAIAAVAATESTLNQRRSEFNRLDANTKSAYKSYANLDSQKQAAWRQYQDAPKSRKDQTRIKWEAIRDAAKGAENTWRQLQSVRDSAEQQLNAAKPVHDTAVAVRKTAQQAYDDTRKQLSAATALVLKRQSSLTTKTGAAASTLSSLAERSNDLKSQLQAVDALSAQLSSVDANLILMLTSIDELKRATWVQGIQISAFVENRFKPVSGTQTALHVRLKEIETAGSDSLILADALRRKLS